MRRLRDLSKAAALLAVGLALAAGAALAQGTMTFRPISADSVARLESDASREARIERRVEKAVEGRAAKRLAEIDRANADAPVSIHVGDDSIVVEAPGSVPEPPEVPEPPSTRESTGEIIRFGSPITVHAGQAVDGDVVSIGGSVRVEGLVKGSVTAVGGDVTLVPGARVDGDVVCMGGTLRQEPGSSISGQLVTAPRVPGARLFLPVLAAVGVGFKIIMHLVWMLFVIGIAFLVVKLAPGRTQAALDDIRSDPGTSFLSGLLLWGSAIPALLVVSIAAALLCITIIGIPLALAALVGLALVFAIAVVWGTITGFALLGGQVFTRFKGGEPTLLRAAIWGVVCVVGLRILSDVLHILPLFGFLGGLVSFMRYVLWAILMTLGAGALVRAEYQRRTVQSWWQQSQFNRRRATGVDDYPPPPSGAAPPPPPSGPAPPPPPAPASPPSAFAPPPSASASSEAWPPMPPPPAPPSDPIA